MPLPTWQQKLIDATSPRDVGAVILRLAQALPGCEQASLLWGDGETQPDGTAVMPADAAWAQDALSGKRHGLSEDGKRVAWRLLPNQRVVLLLHFACGQRERRLRVILGSLLAMASHHLKLALAMADLNVTRLELERSERLQRALFSIARLATADIDQRALYTLVHAVVGQLLNAENFYIALVDESGASLTFPYAVDAIGDEPYRDRALAQGLGEYVMAHGPLLINREDTLDMVRRGLIDLPTVDKVAMHWLGVPLVVNDGVIGVVVLQSYKTDVVYSEADLDLLHFVALQIASSIHRRRSSAALQRSKEQMEQLEQRVEERTQELRMETPERQRAGTALPSGDARSVNRFAKSRSSVRSAEPCAE